jgi:hypothetical protein
VALRPSLTTGLPFSERGLQIFGLSRYPQSLCHEIVGH